MRYLQASRRSRAFSYLEMLTAITILGVLSAIAIPRVVVNQAATKKTACDTQKAWIDAQVRLWYRTKGAWPANDLSDMLPTSTPAQYDYLPEGQPVCPVDGSAYTLDATTHKVIGHNH